MSRHRFFALASVSLTLLTMITAFGAVYVWANPGYEPIPFDKTKWANGDPELRGHMARDLLGKHDFVGMTTHEVRQLLGPPDEDQRDLHRYRYRLGSMGRNAKMPFFFGYSLLINFDDAGKATRAQISD